MDIISKFRLDGKVAIVTGGYGHLGESISLGLAEAGANVAVAGKSLEKFNKTIKRHNLSNIDFVMMDISSSGSINNAFKNIYGKYKRIDILVNNAIYFDSGNPERVTNKKWEYGIDGILNSSFRCIKEVIPYMKKVEKGNIINISSMYGVVSPDFRIYCDNSEYFNPPDYGAAKAGIIQLTRYYAVYLAKYGIRVNCISPGAFPSSKAQKAKKFIKRLSLKIPLERIGEPDELKGVIVFLASEAASYISGQNIIVDGGWTVW